MIIKKCVYVANFPWTAFLLTEKWLHKVYKTKELTDLAACPVPVPTSQARSCKGVLEAMKWKSS